MPASERLFEIGEDDDGFEMDAGFCCIAYAITYGVEVGGRGEGGGGGGGGGWLG